MSINLISGVFENELSKCKKCDISAVGPQLSDHLIKLLAQSNDDPRFEPLYLLHYAIMFPPIKHKLGITGLDLVTNTSEINQQLAQFQWADNDCQRLVASLTTVEAFETNGLKREALQKMGELTTSLLEQGRKALTTLASRDDKTNIQTDEYLIRMAINCVCIAIRLEKSKGKRIKFVENKLSESFNNQLTLKDLKHKIFAIGADTLSHYNIPFDALIQAAMDESKKDTFNRLHTHYKANLAPAVTPATSQTSTTGLESEEDAELPVILLDEFLKETDSSNDSDDPDNPNFKEVPVCSIDNLDDVRKSTAAIDDIKKIATAAYNKLDKGHFLNFIITVLAFRWGHYAKLQALKDINDGKTMPTEEALCKALGMHRFMPFMTWHSRSETRSLQKHKESIAEVNQSTP